MSESYIKQTPEQLVAELTLVTSAPGPVLLSMGITSEQTAAAEAALGDATSAIERKRSALAAVTAASQAKLAAKALAVASLNDLQRTAQASPAPDAVLVSVGFSPRRSTTPRPAIPQQVTEVKALVQPDATVRVSWARGTNSVRATFQVEAGDGTTWTIVGATPRVKLDLGGIQPGLATWIRVTAINAGVASAPSIPVSVYAPASAEPVQLKLAA